MWDTLCTFPLPLCGLLCCSCSHCYRWHFSLLTLYIVFIFQVSFSPLLTVLVLFVFFPSHNHLCVYIQVWRFCLLCIWYGGAYFSWNVYCWALGMDGVYSLLCKTTSIFVLDRAEMYLLFVPFEQLVQHVFWNRGISLQVKTVVAVYTVCCITPFFFFSKSRLRNETSSIHYVH